jgi:ubiquinone/menaquinone biosynthesis C-methylase UbiE
MNPSYSFDRAADFYDATRVYPPGVAEKITHSILDLTRATASTRILEVGIGTGRISAPLIARGLNVTGIDLSREMMDKLRAKFAGQVGDLASALRLALSDASALPFPAETFDVELAVHVFHLIAPWRQAIGEMRRVLRPGGLVLHSTHTRAPQSANVILRNKWHELVEARGQRWKRPGAPNREAVTAEFQSLGASLEEIEASHSTGVTIPRQEIADIAHRIHSDSWVVSDEVLQETVAELTEWAQGHFGALDAPIPDEHVFIWQVMRFDRAPLLPEPIRCALIQLAPILGAAGAPWALGGSCSLALHGVKMTPHDIDIITDADGARRIGDALQRIAEEKQAVAWGEGKRIRSQRGIYRLGDIEIDIVGAGEMREGEDWIPPRSPSEWQTETLTLPGSEAAVTTFTLEHERDAYHRLQREEKVRLIEDRIGELSHLAASSNA